MSPRVLFLDLDGVVIMRHKDRVKLPSGRWVRAATPENVVHLNTIIEQARPIVVVSSSWRKHHQRMFLQRTLARAGYVGWVNDVTPIHCPERARGFEIESWLSLHENVKSYVVLDDDADRGPIPEERWVRTDSLVGLTAHHAAKAINVLMAEAKAA